MFKRLMIMVGTMIVFTGLAFGQASPSLISPRPFLCNKSSDESRPHRDRQSVRVRSVHLLMYFLPLRLNREALSTSGRLLGRSSHLTSTHSSVHCLRHLLAGSGCS